MSFEIIEKEVKYTGPILKCLRCLSTSKKDYTYFLMCDKYYCNDCYKNLPFVNSIIDDKFEALEKISKDNTESLVYKNQMIRHLETRVDSLQKSIVELLDFFDESIKNISETKIIDE